MIPELLGGADTLMIGRVMWNEFFDNADWPMASAVTCAMVLLLLVPMALFQYYQAKATGGEAMIKPNRSLQMTSLGIGFLFLYIPIISLVVYSFNESQLVTVWTEFSLRWYEALLQDDELINAAWLSLARRVC